ncbi:hypothetical protein ABIE66_002789 [Peribacillus sp. B2I2]
MSKLLLDLSFKKGSLHFLKEMEAVFDWNERFIE